MAHRQVVSTASLPNNLLLFSIFTETIAWIFAFLHSNTILLPSDQQRIAIMFAFMFHHVTKQGPQELVDNKEMLQELARHNEDFDGLIKNN